MLIFGYLQLLNAALKTYFLYCFCVNTHTEKTSLLQICNRFAIDLYITDLLQIRI